MISRYEVILGGMALSAISPHIVILDVQHPPASIRNGTYSLAKRQGAHVYRRYIESTSVTVSFMIRAYDIRERQAILQQVVRWAKNGGVLQTSDREGQQLRCICEQYPSVSSVRNWTDPLQITFAAHALPFWQEVLPATLSLTGTSGSGNLYVPGDADDAFVEATITANAALSSLSLTAGDTSISLTGLSIASGGTVVIAYDQDMIQSIRTGSTSLLSKRTGNDDLTVPSGEISAFSFTSDANCTVAFSVRGLWL